MKLGSQNVCCHSITWDPNFLAWSCNCCSNSWGENYVSDDIYFCLQKIIHICFCFFNFPLFGVLDLSAGDPAVPAGLPPSVGRVPGLGRLRTNTAHLQTSLTTIMTQFDLGHKGSNFLFLMDQSTNFYCITP